MLDLPKHRAAPAPRNGSALDRRALVDKARIGSYRVLVDIDMSLAIPRRAAGSQRSALDAASGRASTVFGGVALLDADEERPDLPKATRPSRW